MEEPCARGRVFSARHGACGRRRAAFPRRSPSHSRAPVCTPCVCLELSIAPESFACVDTGVLFLVDSFISARVCLPLQRCLCGRCCGCCRTPRPRAQRLKSSHKIKNQTDFWPDQVETGRYSAPSKLHIRATACQTNEPRCCMMQRQLQLTTPSVK